QAEPGTAVTAPRPAGEEPESLPSSVVAPREDVAEPSSGPPHTIRGERWPRTHVMELLEPAIESAPYADPRVATHAEGGIAAARQFDRQPWASVPSHRSGGRGRPAPLPSIAPGVDPVFGWE